MEFNKIFAAFLVAGIIAALTGFVSKLAVHPDELEDNAVQIEAASHTGGGGAKEKLAEPVLAMIAGADVARGQKVAKACAACHNFENGGGNGVGPNLFGVVGRSKQSSDGFSYSGVLTTQGGTVWTYAELNKFLWKPKKYAPGTKMNFLGLKKPQDRAAVLAYLASLGGKPMPTASDIAAEEAELSPAAVEEGATGSEDGRASAVMVTEETGGVSGSAVEGRTLPTESGSVAESSGAHH